MVPQALLPREIQPFLSVDPFMDSYGGRLSIRRCCERRHKAVSVVLAEGSMAIVMNSGAIISHIPLFKSEC